MSEKEPEKEPEKENMDISKSEIYQVACNIVNDVSELTKKELEEKYDTFKKKFPKLYTICSETTNETKDKNLRELNILLGIRDEVKRGSKNEIEANVQVSEYMAKQYVYPITGEPSLAQKKKALDKIIRGQR